MVRPLPDGLRRATLEDTAAIAHVHVASWRTTYRGLLPDEVLDRLDPSQREALWRRMITAIKPREAVWVIDLPGTGVIGFASCGPLRDRPAGREGDLRALYLLAEHQGTGRGRRLLAASREHLQQLGFSTMWAWVLDGNPAVAFYQACGGRALEQKTVEFAGRPFLEIAYGWEL